MGFKTGYTSGSCEPPLLIIASSEHGFFFQHSAPPLLGRGVSEEVKALGEAPPLLNNYRLPRTVENYDIYVVFLFRDPPSPSFGMRPW